MDRVNEQAPLPRPLDLNVDFVLPATTLTSWASALGRILEDAEIGESVRMALRAGGLLKVQTIREKPRRVILDLLAKGGLGGFVIDVMEEHLRYNLIDNFKFTHGAEEATDTEVNEAHARQKQTKGATNLSFDEHEAVFPLGFDVNTCGRMHSTSNGGVYVQLPVMIQSALPSTKQKPLDSKKISVFTNAFVAFMLIQCVSAIAHAAGPYLAPARV